MASDTLYASVILPLSVEGTFTYIVPPEMADGVRTGCRVIVPFGKRHFYTGIVESVSSHKPTGLELKPIALTLDKEPIVTDLQLRLWNWIAGYYLCTVGEVMNAALPSALKIESETRLQIPDDIEPEAFANCTPAEIQIIDYIRSNPKASVKAVEKDLSVRAAGVTITRMLENGLICVNEKLVERFRSVHKPYAALTLPRGDRHALSTALDSLKRSKRQEEILVALVSMSQFLRPDLPAVEVPLEALLQQTGSTRAVVRALVDKGLVRIYPKEISRFTYEGPVGGPLPSLSPAQEQAFSQINQSFDNKDITLLHGVTSSGKTEIYIHLIDRTLKSGTNALLLVPEIALTTQLTHRLQHVFGDKVIIYHSKFSDNERVEIWRRVLQSREPKVIIGARSAVFLPFDRLGLVIVDEEHESSYKQQDPAPRYNARDVASVLARMHGAHTLYGSATPSIETYYKAITGQFGLVELSERFAGGALPEIEIVNMRGIKQPRGQQLLFSPRLREAVEKASAAHRQTILFHNRRGFAPMARCATCGFTPKCDFCDVSLTYHRRANVLKCHYCGTDYPVPEVCPQCGEPTVEVVGYGTERLEDEVDTVFSGRRVLRMDLETTRNKDGYSRIIDIFSEGGADILVGTQMVTKGLDFGGVDVVGIINADALINFPDFRASERAFNMMEQVAGRAGRRTDGGKVIIQTFKPDQPVLEFVRNHDYKGFYTFELEQRRLFNFPPFCRIINIYLKHRDANIVTECARTLAANLRKIFGARVLGPQEPAVSRVQNLYIRKIMLKIEPELKPRYVREQLRAQYIALNSSPLMKGLTVYYDPDPA